MDIIRFLCVSLGSSTVELHDSPGSRRACACWKAGFSSQNDDRALGEYYRRAAFYCTFFCEQKDSMLRIFIKKCFLFTVGSVCLVNWFTTWSRNSLKDVRKSQIIPDQVQKWLRQQSKDFFAAGFDSLVKRWDKCISVGGGYVEK
jgi:hypothetical protein